MRLNPLGPLAALGAGLPPRNERSRVGSNTTRSRHDDNGVGRDPPQQPLRVPASGPNHTIGSATATINAPAQGNVPGGGGAMGPPRRLGTLRLPPAGPACLQPFWGRKPMRWVSSAEDYKRLAKELELKLKNLNEILQKTVASNITLATKTVQ